MKEFVNDYLPEYSSIRNRYDDYHERNNAINRFLFTYIALHPKSYVALWQLAFELRKGYTTVLDSAFNLFSNSIKFSYTGKILERQLKEGKLIAVGSQFPKLTLSTISGKKIKILESGNLSNYTLIDFWFSHCPPCLKQFDSFKKLYESNKNHGLEIIGISTDKEKDIKLWKKIIRDSALNWIQYLDVNGTTSQKLGIELFPQIFSLIDLAK